MGRMWQTLLLTQWKPLFAWLPVETLIRERQQEYYDVLAAADRAADSTAFIEFMLRAFCDSLKEFLQTEQVREQVTDQVKRQLWGEEFWSDGYFVSTVSKYGNEEIISNYVRLQGTEKEYKQIYKKQLELF